MTLYFAPAIGVYLIAKCRFSSHPIQQVIILTITVLVVFLLLWLPVIIYRPIEATAMEAVEQGNI